MVLSTGCDKRISVSVRTVDPWYASHVDLHNVLAEHGIYCKVLVIVVEFKRVEEAPISYHILKEYRKRIRDGKALVIFLLPSPSISVNVGSIFYSWLTRVVHEDLVDAIIIVGHDKLTRLRGLSINGDIIGGFDVLGELVATIVSNNSPFLNIASRLKDSKIWIAACLLGTNPSLYDDLASMFKALELGGLIDPWIWEPSDLVLVMRTEPRLKLKYEDIISAFNDWIKAKLKKPVNIMFDFSKTPIGSTGRVNMVLLERIQEKEIDELIKRSEAAYKEHDVSAKT